MSSLAPMEGTLRTRCSQCSHEFYIRPSLAMQMGMNTGHVPCPQCKAFLHVELLEGDAAWTELFSEWLAKQPSLAESAESEGAA